MKIYWKEHKMGQRLVLLTDDGQELEAGAVRSTPRGYNAFATARGYDPGRAQKGFPSMEVAKAFVESFEVWKDYPGGQNLEVEPDVHILSTD